MLEILFPKLYVDKIQDIDLEILEENKIKGLILDIDNTLVPQYTIEADENAVKWIEKVKNAGFQVCIVSNNSEKRVIKFNEKLKVHAIHKASKPSNKAFKKAVTLMGISPLETAVIGDQIFTDVFGGNRMKMFTVLVKPIHPNEPIYIKLKRLAEKPVLSSFKRKLKLRNVK